MTALTVALILGVTLIAGAVVYRVAGAGESGFDPRAIDAGRIVLPEDETVIAAGAAGAALIVATRDAQGAERLRLFSTRDGAALKTVEIARAAP